MALRGPIKYKWYCFPAVTSPALWHYLLSSCLPAQGYVHSQLRQRTGAMLEVLERASFAPQEQKTRKTSSGRTFVEQAAAGTA